MGLFDKFKNKNKEVVEQDTASYQKLFQMDGKQLKKLV